MSDYRNNLTSDGDGKNRVMDFGDIYVENQVARQSTQSNSERWEYWKPTEAPELIQLIPGSYAIDGATWPVYPNWEAFIKNGGPRGKGSSCHCRCNGGKDTSKDCVLHWALNRDLKAHRGPDGQVPREFQSTFRPRLQYAISMYRLSYFHKTQVAAVGRDGASYMRPEYQRCTEEDEFVNVEDTLCPGCNTKAERFFGQRRYMQAGKRYFETLIDIGHRIGEKCKICGSKIITMKYVCPACADRSGVETVLLDPRRPPAGFDHNDIPTFWKTAVMCQCCGRKVKPREVIKCKGGCENPVRRTIFDAPICIARQGKGSDSTLVHVGDIMDPVDYPDDLKAKMMPYDFSTMFTVTTQQQATALGFEDPFRGGGAVRSNDDEPIVEDVPWG